MDISLTRINDAICFEAKNENGASIQLDGAPEMGGVNGGLRPMEGLLAALASCSAFEVVSILKKQKQQLEKLRIKVSGKRTTNKTVQPFSEIRIHFDLTGEVDHTKAAKAVALSLGSYCSVRASLHPDIEITHSIEIKPT